MAVSKKFMQLFNETLGRNTDELRRKFIQGDWNSTLSHSEDCMGYSLFKFPRITHKHIEEPPMNAEKQKMCMSFTPSSNKKDLKLREQLSKELQNIKEKKLAKSKRERENWEFTTASVAAINVDEIAITLDDDKLVAWVIPEVSIPPSKNGSKAIFKAKFDAVLKATPVFVIVHRRIMQKAKALQIAKATCPSLKTEVASGHTSFQLDNVHSIDIIMDWIKLVRSTKWGRLGTQKVAVRYPKV